MSAPDNYAHLIEIDEMDRCLYIYRVSAESRKKTLYTQAHLPDKSYNEDEHQFHQFAKQLGENILIDSPAARRLLGLD